MSAAKKQSLCPRCLITLVMMLVTIWRATFPVFGADSEKLEHQYIIPNPAIQAFLKTMVSTNEQQVLGGTEAAIREKFEQLRKMAGLDKYLVLQLLYFNANAKNEKEYWLPWAIVEQLGISNEIFAEVGFDMLDATNSVTRKLAFNCLTRADHNPQGGVDFSRYEVILREKKQSPPQGLIRYMYDRNPQAAVFTFARVFGQDVPESEVAIKAKSGNKESVEYFADRSEWWAHLYVAVIIEKEPSLRTPVMLKRLREDKDPLVRKALVDHSFLNEVSSTNVVILSAKKTIKTFELNIPFKSDKSEIGAESYRQLDEIAQELKINSRLSAKIEGHTDKVKKSNANYSKKLTERRAQAVLDYLAKSGGIETNRMTAEGSGFTSPKMPNDPDVGNPVNRRIEVHIQEDL